MMFEQRERLRWASDHQAIEGMLVMERDERRDAVLNMAHDMRLMVPCITRLREREPAPGGLLTRHIVFDQPVLRDDAKDGDKETGAFLVEHGDAHAAEVIEHGL